MGITRKVSKLLKETRRGGLRHGLKKATDHIDFLIENWRPRPDPIYKRRVKLYEDLNARLNSTVAYGPFKGMVMVPEVSWGGPDRAPMLLGIYEQEVIEALEKAQAGSQVFIDLGAAEGYYAVGVLIAGWFEKAYCFEMNELGQEIIRRNAAANGVSNSLTVYGTANKGFYVNIPARDLHGAVMLVDIEGAEFDLLDSDALQALCSTTIIIEIHDWVADAASKLRHLIESARATHSITKIRTGARDPGLFDELKGHSDTDRWLLCSEDRPVLMEWLKLVPKPAIAGG